MNNPTTCETLIVHELNKQVIELNRLSTLERDFKTLNRLSEHAYCVSVLMGIITRSGIQLSNVDTIKQMLTKVNKTI